MLSSCIPKEHFAIESAFHDRFSGQIQQFCTCSELFFSTPQFVSALCDALFQLIIQRLEHAGLAMQLDEDADLRSQHLRHDRNGNIVNSAAAITLNLVGVRQVNPGDEDDRSLLESWVLADHVGQFESI